jgi:hypothetical protein
MGIVEVSSARPASSRRSTWVKALVAVVAVLLLAGLAVWRMGTVLDDSFGCPSQEWATALGAEVQGFVPADSGPSFGVSDCDGRRSVELDSVGPDVTPDVVRQAAISSGWAVSAEAECLEKDFDGLAASLRIAEVTQNHVRLYAVRGSC